MLSILLLGAAALAAVGVSRQERWLVFEFYGMVFLLAAAVASGLLNFLVSALVGTPAECRPRACGWSRCARCFATCSRSRARLSDGFGNRCISVLPRWRLAPWRRFLSTGWSRVTALSVMPGAHHLALIRTVTLCAAALALVSGGARWRRRELTRLGYAAIALVAVKLVTEDLRHGHLAYIAASIFLVAFTLIAAPRVARARQRA